MNFNVVGVNTYIIGSDDCLDFLDGLYIAINDNDG